MKGVLYKMFAGLPVKVGRKDAKDPMEREWESGIFKKEVDGPIWIGETGIEGDGQADLKHHGGPEKAIFAYSLEHYHYWKKTIPEANIIHGGMGENFLIHGMTEEDVCIGDTYEIGGAVIQVSQPRQPCWKPARRFRIKKLALLIQESGRTGWYYRVLKEGVVGQGQEFRLVERPFPKWTIAKCNQVMHVDKENKELSKELSECSLLAPNWRKTLRDRVEQGIEKSIEKRIIGPNE